MSLIDSIGSYLGFDGFASADVEAVSGNVTDGPVTPIDWGAPDLLSQPVPTRDGDAGQPMPLGQVGAFDTSFASAFDSLLEGDFLNAGAAFRGNVGNFVDNFREQVPALARDVANLPQMDREWDPFTLPVLRATADLLDPPTTPGTTPYRPGVYAGFTLNTLDAGLGLLGARFGLGGGALRMANWADEVGGLTGSLATKGADLLGAGASFADKAIDWIKPLMVTGTTFQGSVSYNSTSGDWGFAALTSPFNYGTATSAWTGLSWPIETFNDDGQDLNFVVRQMVDQRFNEGHQGINGGASAWWDPFTGEVKIGAYGPEVNFSTSPHFPATGSVLPSTTIRWLGEGNLAPWFGIKYNYNGK